MSGIFRVTREFLWGASTASHQVEGGNRWNDWWEAEQSGRLPFASGDACAHFEHYERDFDMARDWGHSAHRLSIEWSRVEPTEGQFDRGAIEHYADVIRALRERGIEPVVTLHHFTNPAWLARRGGWASSDAVRLFERYVSRVAIELAPHVRFWVTINEPTVYMMRGYVMGDWPPFMPRAWSLARRVLRNLMRGHRAAYAAIHARRSDAMVGFSHSAPYIVPHDPRRTGDRLAASARDFVLNQLCFRHLGRPLSAALDFIGINYYVRQSIRWEPRGIGAFFGREYKEADVSGERRFSSLGWEVYPEGLYQTLLRFGRLGLPLIVTENGIATEDDALRSEFLLQHVGALGRAMESGVDVRGYLYWTLFDNYEWSHGFAPKFGLAAVDSCTQKRIARPVAGTFEVLCKSGEIPLSQAPASNVSC